MIKQAINSEFIEVVSSWINSFGLGLSLWSKGVLSWCGSSKVLKWLCAADRWQCIRWSCGTKAYPLILEYWDKYGQQNMCLYERKYFLYILYWPISGFPAFSIFSHVIFVAHHSIYCIYVCLKCKSTIRCTNNVPKHIIPLNWDHRFLAPSIESSQKVL